MIAKLFMKLMGWKVQPNLPEGINHCVMIAAPHTSNWDLAFARATFSILKIPVRFTIKDSWFKFPLNLIFGPLGGIPINRAPKKAGEERPSTVEAMANLFEGKKELVVLVTPEGSRSLRTEWKTGFYHVAKLANVNPNSTSTSVETVEINSKVIKATENTQLQQSDNAVVQSAKTFSINPQNIKAQNDAEAKENGQTANSGTSIMIKGGGNAK